MALYQKSVLNKYLKGLDQTKVDAAYQKFSAHFHNPSIQLNIRKAKEEQYQGGFLIDLFVKVFGYIKNPEPNFNLTTELKNVKGSKKADGAIMQNGKAIAVIELKGMNTPNLDKVEAQAFGYKSNQPDAVYVITSNFEKLRFYIDNAVDFIEWNLFNLTREQFNEVWLCLAKESVLSGLPKQIKEDSIIEEKTITERLYKDYSTFRSELYNSIAKKNPDIDPLLLFKKTQKLLDRFLFIFFAEDRLLVPPNSISRIIDRWKQLEELDNYKPLYAIFQQYFGYFNNGRKGKKSVDDIFAYNGGLFKSDTLLDKIEIDDYVLFKHTQKLTKYDFVSEVDVNILGHIFEHSLNDIEEIAAQLEGETLDKSKTKRKKDGVFYTPKYITKYIVENTVGKLCEEKKTELGIDDIDFSKTYLTKKKRTTKDGKKTFLSAEGEKILNGLNEYREYLLGLTICDPACGSGAFLNQAFNYLIDEHENIDQYNASLRGDMMTLTDVSKDILENNLFGVDINNEAVEIAKLSLWLRTAQKGRKLNNLNENIKCGNSVIDDPEVAGEKAFNWEKEFPEVFENGGFDVVIGNPPYVRQELIAPYKDFFKSRYLSFNSMADLYIYFIEKSINELTKKDGLYSIIVGNKWLMAGYSKKLREFIKTKDILKIIDFGDLPVFKNVAAYPCIITVKNSLAKTEINVSKIGTLDFSDLDLYIKGNNYSVPVSSLKNDGWMLSNPDEVKILEKIKNSTTKTLDNIIKKDAYRGIISGLDGAFVIDKESYSNWIETNPKCKEVLKPYLIGRDIQRYGNTESDKYLILFPCGYTNKNTDKEDKWEWIKDNFIQIANHLEPFKDAAEKRWDKGDYWWELRPCDYYDKFGLKKIIYLKFQVKPAFTFDTTGAVGNSATWIITNNDILILAILNSKLGWYLISKFCTEIRGGYQLIYKYLKNIPIALPAESIKLNLDSKVTFIMENNKALSTNLLKMGRSIKRQFDIDKLSKNLQSWHTLTYIEFTKELKKKKIKLGLAEEAEWEEYFEAEKAKAQAIQAVIDKTDKEIDQMVYELYGLTKEEIKIVENAST